MVKNSNPISEYFLHSISPAFGGPIGWEYAVEVVKNAKINFGIDLPMLGYLNAWNDRSGKPFTVSEIHDLDRMVIEKPKRKKKQPKPLPGVPLFE